MKPLNIPDRLTCTLYVHTWTDPNHVLYGDLGFVQTDPSDWEGHILLGKVDIDIPLDSAGTLDKQVAQLRSAKKRIIDEAADKASQIDVAIESLLAIEYKEPQPCNTTQPPT